MQMPMQGACSTGRVPEVVHELPGITCPCMSSAICLASGLARPRAQLGNVIWWLCLALTLLKDESS